MSFLDPSLSPGYVQWASVAMVHTILSSSVRSMTNGEMKHCALEPHHRELQIDISKHMIVSNMSHLWTNSRFEAARRKNT